jgi:hypothetical protein
MNSQQNLDCKRSWNISLEYLQKRREESARKIDQLYIDKPHMFVVCEQCKGPQLRGASCTRCYINSERHMK